MANQPSHGDVLEAIRNLIGERVLLQMRTGVAGDLLNVRGVLKRLRTIEEEGTMVVLDTGEAVLHLHELGAAAVVERRLSDDGAVAVRYANGCFFRCHVEGGA